MYTREETIRRMNGLGRAGAPFFFVISHDLEHNLLFERKDGGQGRSAAFPCRWGNAADCGTVPLSRSKSVLILFPVPCPGMPPAFSSVRAHLLRGDSYLLNLCVATPVKTNLTLPHLFRFARAPYRMLLGPDASVSGVHGRACACFSPEPFVRVRGREIATFPMKGTADAATPGSPALAGGR